MAETITVQISEPVLTHARQMAFSSRKTLEEVLSRWLEISFAEPSFESLSDEEVLALSYMKMSAHQEKRFSDLLAGNREGELTAAEQDELNEFMEYYGIGLLRKSQALVEAVKRGLRQPPAF